MKVHGKPFRTIWIHPRKSSVVQIIDQRALPHRFVIEDISSVKEMETAIKDMHLRGAPLIGAAAGYGVCLAVLESEKGKNAESFIQKQMEILRKTRPTAVNLAWALEIQKKALSKARSFKGRKAIAFQTARQIAADDVETCRRIGMHGLGLIQAISKKKKGKPVNILTHCNAGWLATVDWGTATSAIYQAFNQGIKVHVWVDETRPRNQGASLTAWELSEHGVPHTVIADNTGGHLMQHGEVDLVIVGTDRTTRTGDVANKIGTYLKALAAYDNHVPFYVAVPSSSIDWKLTDGVKEIPIEERSADEVTFIEGLAAHGKVQKIRLTPAKSKAINYGFDVTPRRLITGLITERGICKANESALLKLFPEKK